MLVISCIIVCHTNSVKCVTIITKLLQNGKECGDEEMSFMQCSLFNRTCKQFQVTVGEVKHRMKTQSL